MPISALSDNLLNANMKYKHENSDIVNYKIKLYGITFKTSMLISRHQRFIKKANKV